MLDALFSLSWILSYCYYCYWYYYDYYYYLDL